MSLKNLVGVSLDVITPDKAQVAHLLAAARRNIADAQLAGLSCENRFDAAYKAVMQLAMAGLHANGYRTLTSKPGHHQTALQTLPSAWGWPPKRCGRWTHCANSAIWPTIPATPCPNPRRQPACSRPGCCSNTCATGCVRTTPN